MTNNSNNQAMNGYSQRSRGSITSGIPILPSMNSQISETGSNSDPTNNGNGETTDTEAVVGYNNQQPTVAADLAGTNNSETTNSFTNSGGGGSFMNFYNRLNRVASLSSEDEDSNHANNNNSNSFNFAMGDSATSAATVIKHPRKSKSRHEPYMDPALGGGSSATTPAIGPTSSSYLSRSSASKSQSFSSGSVLATNSKTNELGNLVAVTSSTSNSFHRDSEPNPLDLISANRAHLELIYNQSISNKTELPLNKELQLLQLENPCVDEQTQQKWQVQHKTLMKNNSFVNRIILIFLLHTPSKFHIIQF